MKLFTADEKAILKMYATSDMERVKVATAILESTPLVDNQEIADLMASVVKKATAMSDEEFSRVDLSDVVEPDS